MASAKDISLDTILRPHEPTIRRTKIVCTIGPSSWDVDQLVRLIDAGMNVARLNFSHGDHERHAETVRNIRAAAAERPEHSVAIMLDTKGPEIRTGFLEDGPVQLDAGQALEITTDYEFKGTKDKIACSYAALPETVKEGDTILAADGNLVMTVEECKEDSVFVRVENNYLLGERKNMNLPGCIVKLPTVTEKDERDLVDFGLAHGVDMIAASFVRKASDIDCIREVLGPRGRMIKIIAKIENQEGLENFDEILERTDGIMVARGDLGMEIPPEKVFLAQKMMIYKSNMAGKPVVTATQMLESMGKNPRPTRAEATDVANAVFDGTDAVMLSGETASGDYPIKAVKIMARICVEAEAAIDHDALFLSIREGVSKPLPVFEAIASSAVKTQIDLGAKAIVVLTDSGNTARLVAKYRPPVPILVLTASTYAARQTSGYIRGCEAHCLGSMIGTESILTRAAEMTKARGWTEDGDSIVAIHGLVEARSGATNILKVLVV
eukprot:PLAT9927.1.p2 GENE.PLAT9927.1~~PLAT9927.1.p2  ORF type:complete len:496 (+),score=225.93 PLAT9927.1:60-1547(+)